MIIDWKEYNDKRHVLAWFLVEAMSQEGIGKYEEFDSSAIDVRMTINGVETNFIESMEFLQRQLNDIEDEGFKKGVKEASYRIQENISKILDCDE